MYYPTANSQHYFAQFTYIFIGACPTHAYFRAARIRTRVYHQSRVSHHATYSFDVCTECVRKATLRPSKDASIDSDLTTTQAPPNSPLLSQLSPWLLNDNPRILLPCRILAVVCSRILRELAETEILRSPALCAHRRASLRYQRGFEFMN